MNVSHAGRCATGSDRKAVGLDQSISRTPRTGAV